MGVRVTCLNFKTSHVGALSMFHVAVENLKKGCCLSQFRFKCCRYFLGHVACRNLPWQSLRKCFLCSYSDNNELYLSVTVRTLEP